MQEASCAASARAPSMAADATNNASRPRIMSAPFLVLRLQRRVQRVVEKRRSLDGLVVVRCHERKAARDRAQSGALPREVNLVREVSAPNDPRKTGEHRIARAVL